MSVSNVTSNASVTSATVAVVALPGNDALASALCRELRGRAVPLAIRSFPDGETHVRLHGTLAGSAVVVAATLDRPDAKLVPLALVARAARDAGASRVVLASPYLAYMRQDAVFEPGEGISSRAFAALLATAFDGLATVDPHLHRHASLDEVFSIPSIVVPSAPDVAAFLRRQAPDAVIVGPDEESAQWARAVADELGAPWIALRKVRRGDHDVEIEAPDPFPQGRTPVIVDDILSTGGTMLQAARALRASGAPPPIVVATHAVFAADPRAALSAAGVREIVTTNTIPHDTNSIDVHAAVAAGIASLLG